MKNLLLLIFLFHTTLTGLDKVIEYEESFNIKIDDTYEFVAVGRIKSSIEVVYINKETEEQIVFNSMGIYSDYKIKKDQFFSCMNDNKKCFSDFSESFYRMKKKIDYIKNEDFEAYIFEGSKNIYFVYIFVKNTLEVSINYISSNNQESSILNIKKILNTIQIKQLEHVTVEDLVSKFEIFDNNKEYDTASNLLIQALVRFKDSKEIRNIAKKYFKKLCDKRLIAIEYYESSQ